MRLLIVLTVKNKFGEDFTMDKRAAAEMVAEMVGLEFGYVLEAATYFSSLEEAFNWIYLSDENPIRPLSELDLIHQLASITIEQMQELNANTPAEYMVIDHDHTYITSAGIAYLRIQR